MDRGSFSVENVLTLFAFKVLYPNAVFLTRGNHETKNMNKVRRGVHACPASRGVCLCRQ